MHQEKAKKSVAVESSQGVQFVTIDASADGQRIDNFLLRILKGVPRTHIYRVLRTGNVRVNTGRIKPGHRLSIGDVVRIPPLRVASRTTHSAPEKLLEKIKQSIVYEDNTMLVLNKPSGLAVHGGSGISLGAIECLRQARPEANGLELAHRLDRDTSGCLMVAKRRSSLRRLQDLQRGGRIAKTYLALLHGRCRKRRFTVDAPLRKNSLRGGERIVSVDPAGKASRTRFNVIEQFADSLLVEAELETGRTHQIRVHAAHVGLPLLGDAKYGDQEGNQKYRELGLRRLFLHAWRLRIPCDPEGGALTVEAPLPGALQTLLAGLRRTS